MDPEQNFPSTRDDVLPPSLLFVVHLDNCEHMFMFGVCVCVCLQACAQGDLLNSKLALKLSERLH